MKWEKKSIREFADVFDGPHATPKESINGPVFLGIKNIKPEGGIDLTDIRHISDSEYEKWTKRVTPKKDDIVLSYEATLHRYAIIPDSFVGCLGRRMALVRVDENKVYYKFLYYTFLSDTWRGFIDANKLTGATVDRISITDFPSYFINFPPLPTQHRISSILSAYDDLIENNLKRIKLLEETAFLSYKGIVRNEKSLIKYPLAEIATVTSSKRIFLSDYVEDGVPFYRSKEIIAKSNFESIDKPLYITEGRYNDIKIKFGIPVNGDLLITAVGTIGFIHLVNEDDGEFYFKDGNLIWIRNITNRELVYFLFFKFRTKEFREMLNSVAIGSSQKALTIETVKKIEIEIPSNDSLIEFNNETKTIIKLIYNLQNQNTKLREARDILLPRLMSGEIEV